MKKRDFLTTLIYSFIGAMIGVFFSRSKYAAAILIIFSIFLLSVEFLSSRKDLLEEGVDMKGVFELLINFNCVFAIVSVVFADELAKYSFKIGITILIVDALIYSPMTVWKKRRSNI